VALQYSQATSGTYGVFDNHHTTAGRPTGDIYSQYNATDPYSNYYNYDNSSTTTNGAAAGILPNE